MACSTGPRPMGRTGALMARPSVPAPRVAASGGAAPPAPGGAAPGPAAPELGIPELGIPESGDPRVWDPRFCGTRAGAQAIPAIAGGCPGPTKPSFPSTPWATLVTAGGEAGVKPVICRNATRTSSGRTAGSVCRITIRIIAQESEWSAEARDPASIVSTAPRASRRRTPFLVSRSTCASAAARNSRVADAAASGEIPGSSTSHSDIIRRLFSVPPASSLTSITSIPSGSAVSSAERSRTGSCATVSARVRYSASLATPVWVPLA